jgi:hypothetical protein
MWITLSVMKKQLQEQRASDGELKSVDLLARSESKGERSYRYRLTFADRTYIVSMTLNKEGKISGLSAEEE